jgi:hypothetical protein
MERTEYPVVYQERSFWPRDARRLARHHKPEHRRGKKWCNEDLLGGNEVVAGSIEALENFAEEVSLAAQENRLELARAKREKGRPGEARKVLDSPVENPWKQSQTKGVLRGYVKTADATWFEDDNFSGLGFRDPEKVEKFKAAATASMWKHFKPEDILFAVWEVDERGPHLHIYARHWKETVSKNRGRQQLLQPTDMKLSRNPERAQDLVADDFAHLGLVRGKRHAEERRKAKREGRPIPPKPKVTSVRDWALEQSIARQKEERRAAENARCEREAAEAAVAHAARVRKKAAEEIRRKQEEARQERVEQSKRIREEWKQRQAAIEKRETEIAEKQAAQDARDTDLDRREQGLVQHLKEFMSLADPIRQAARKAGLTDHPLVQSGLEAVEKMRDLIGRIGGRQRTR